MPGEVRYFTLLCANVILNQCNTLLCANVIFDTRQHAIGYPNSGRSRGFPLKPPFAATGDLINGLRAHKRAT